MDKQQNILLNNTVSASRFVINDNHDVFPSDVMIRKNRPVIKKRPSAISIILIIFFISLLGVLAIRNIMRVNQLADEVNQLRNRYTSIINSNELLHAEINNRTSSDTILIIAYKEIGMIKPKEQPHWFEIE